MILDTVLSKANKFMLVFFALLAHTAGIIYLTDHVARRNAERVADETARERVHEAMYDYGTHIQFLRGRIEKLERQEPP